MSESKEQLINKLQRELIGARFEGSTFANISFGRNNQNAIAKWIVNPSKILLIMGSPGTGKTYTCSAILGWMYGKVISIRYWNERDLLQRIRSFISSQVGGDYIKELGYILDDEFLIIDDMGSCSLNDWRREVWLEIVDSRYESQKPTVITTNLTREEIHSQLGARTYSRLLAKENTIIDMHGHEDLRQREPEK